MLFREFIEATTDDISQLKQRESDSTSTAQVNISPSQAASRECLSSGFPTMSDTNWGVQPKKMARRLKFRI